MNHEYRQENEVKIDGMESDFHAQDGWTVIDINRISVWDQNEATV